MKLVKFSPKNHRFWIKIQDFWKNYLLSETTLKYQINVCKRQLQWSSFVSGHVRREALWIRCVDHDSPPHLAPQKIDLSEAIDAGHITVCELKGQGELDSFVHFAQQLDDGEASALALARSRGWAVATDDKKARRIAGEEGIRVISTSELIRSWVESQGMNASQIGERLRRIHRFGRFRPRRTDSSFATRPSVSQRMPAS